MFYPQILLNFLKFGSGSLPKTTTRNCNPTGGLKFSAIVEIPPYHYGAIFERSLG